MKYDDIRIVTKHCRSRCSDFVTVLIVVITKPVQQGNIFIDSLNFLFSQLRHRGPDVINLLSH